MAFDPQVWTPLPLHLVAPGVHSPVQVPAPEHWYWHTSTVVQEKPLPHFSTPRPLQRVDPCAHVVQVPFTQPVEQEAAVCHWPAVEHVSVPFPAPLQRPAPGVQTPEQTPFEQTEEHVSVVTHWPVAEHVCAPRPEHRFDPGEHVPAQAPAEHT